MIETTTEFSEEFSRPITERDRQFFDVNLMQEYSQSDVMERVSEIFGKLNLKNRNILTEADSVLEAVSQLACPHCILLEGKKREVDLKDLKGIFQRYKGRLKLDKIQSSDKERKNGKVVVTFNLKFKHCDYCGKQGTISLTEENFTEERFKKILEISNKYLNEEMKRELDF